MQLTVRQQIDILKEYITEHRWQLFNKVVNYRTEYITVVLEDIYQPHNASAVLRTCDIFGVQNVHIIENRNKYTINPDVAVGAYKWLNLIKYNKTENNTLEAINQLRKQGYRIVATTPHIDDVELKEFDLYKGKVALLFGSELPGLSEIALQNADEFLKIEMFGFTESFNISVSVAIILHHLITKLHQSQINWQLTQQQKEELLLKWLKQHIKQADKIIERKIEQLQKPNI